MSKLSLSKRLLGSSEEKLPLPNPSALEIQGSFSVPKPAPVVAPPPQDCSPLSGWSDGSDESDREPQNLQTLPQQEEHETTETNPDDTMDPLYYDEEPPVLHELYDADYFGGGMSYMSEHEEEEEELEEEDDAVDLCDSPPPPPQVSPPPPPPETLDLNNKTEENIETEENVNHHHRACQVCGIELASMHYLQQVKHVKQCLSKRHLQGDIHMPPPPAAAPLEATNTAATTAASKRKFLEMDIRDWLHELEFDAYIDKFIAEEIDMTLVHALHEEDLALLGISSLLEQRKFMRAAKKVGEEVHAAKKIKRAAAKAKTAPLGHKNSNTAVPLPQQKKKQQTLQHLGVSSSSTAANLANRGGGGNKNRTGSSNGVQLAEQALLLNLYPETNRYTVDSVEETRKRATTTTGDDDEDICRAPLPTPPLPPTTALASARVPSSVSLFTSAAHCKQVTETLEARIEKRRTERPLSDKNEQLGRGGLTFSKVEESRAIKAMKLQALKEELRTHESTVAELRRLIAGLEADLK